MPRYAIECEWNGRGYAGTAIQPDAETLHSILNAMSQAIEEPQAQWRCSSRLDAGVSALALPAHVELEREWDINTLGRALSSHTPDAVGIRSIARVADDWDALRSTSIKHYQYRVLLRPWKPALDAGCWHLKRLSHPELLQKMAEMIPGEHDLSGFSCLRGDDTDAQDPKRVYHTANWEERTAEGGRLFEFNISAAGFLYRQVRALVGSMLAVAQGSYPFEAFEALLHAGRDGQRCGNIAPAHGLCLQRVVYKDQPNWQHIDWA